MTLREKAIMLRKTLQLVLFSTSTSEAVKIGEQALKATEDLGDGSFPKPPLSVPPAVWADWIDYRKKLGGCRDWDRLFQRQSDWLGSQPEGDRSEIINQSLRQGWQGLFPLKSSVKASVNGGRDSSNQSGMDKLIHQKELERIMDRMKLIANSYSGHQDWRQPDREEYRRLKARREELKGILGVMI